MIKRTNAQNYAIELILNILNQNSELRKKRYIKQILDEIIHYYPEITEDSKATWKKIPMYLKYFKISTKAAEILKSVDWNNMTWKKVHYEHIYPRSRVLRDLMSLTNPNQDAVSTIMDRCEIVIISKEEQTLLDGSANKTYLFEGSLVKGKSLKSGGSTKERLEAIGCKIEPFSEHNSLTNPLDLNTITWIQQKMKTIKSARPKTEGASRQGSQNEGGSILHQPH